MLLIARPWLAKVSYFVWRAMAILKKLVLRVCMNHRSVTIALLSLFVAKRRRSHVMD